MKAITCLLIVAALSVSLFGCAPTPLDKLPDDLLPPSPDVSIDVPLDVSPSPDVTPSGDDTFTDWNFAIASIDGADVMASELRFQMASLFGYFEQNYGAIDWSGTVGEMSLPAFFLNESLHKIKTFRAVEQLAIEVGFALTEEQFAQMDEQYIADAVEMYGSVDEFEAVLIADGMTPEVYRYIAYIPSLYEGLYNRLYVDEGATLAPTEEQVHGFYTNNFLTVRHIVMRLANDLGIALSEEEMAAKLALMEEAVTRYEGGEDFGALMNEYSEDTYLTTDMTVFVDEMLDEYVAAVASLDAGQISAIEQFTDVYAVIQRLELSDEYYAENRDALFSKITQDDFIEVLEARVLEMDVQVYDAYYELDAEAIYNNGM